MKERTRKYVRLSLILYVALLSAAVIATTAWFITSRTASIKTSEDMVIQAGQQLEISMVDGSTDWGSTIKVPVVNQSIPDITGDGVSFYYPTTLDANDMPIMSDASTFLNVTDNPDGEYYIELKVKFRTAAKTKVYLSNNSAITPKDVELDDTNDLTGTVSKDVLAGAVRVCFLEEIDGEYVNRAIWIPNDTYQLESTGDGHTFTPNGVREDSYGYLLPNGNEMTAHMWDVSHFRTGKVLIGNTALASSSLTVDETVVPAMTNGGTPLLTFEGGTQKTEKTLVIRVWLEGTDREANTSLVGGQFSYNLEFISINKEENSDSLGTVTWVGDTLQGIPNNTQVEYSFNAIDWMPYSNLIDGAKAEDTIVYVRVKETAGKTCGVVNAIPRSSVAQ